MNIDRQIESYLSSIVGKRLNAVLVGPAGVHYEFEAPNGGAVKQIEFSILSNTSIRINADTKECLFSCGPYPAFINQATLQLFLAGKFVSNASVDCEKNALRMILDHHILLSLIPFVIESGRETTWSIRSHPQGNWNELGPGFLVSRSEIRAI